MAPRHHRGGADADGRGGEPRPGTRRRLPPFPVAGRSRIAADPRRRQFRPAAEGHRTQRRRRELWPQRRGIHAGGGDLALALCRLLVWRVVADASTTAEIPNPEQPTRRELPTPPYPPS